MFKSMFQNLKEAIKEGVVIRKPAVKAVKESTKKAVIRVNGKIIGENVEVNQEVIREDETIQAETVVTAKKVKKSKSAKVKGWLFRYSCHYLYTAIFILLKLIGLSGLPLIVLLVVSGYCVFKACNVIIDRNYWF